MGRTAMAVVGVAALATATMMARGGATLPPRVRRHLPVAAPAPRLVVGNPADVARSPLGGLLLAGGGSDVDAAMAWFAARANGGDLVVLRASGREAYNAYIAALAPVDSVETLVVPSRERADDPFVERTVRGAEAVFIAGGDQADYVRHWRGSRLAAALEVVLARGAALGGTSAGLAVLGAFDFAALAGTVTSSEALADPYDPRITLVRDFVTPAPLAAVVTDSHFAARDRMGRLVTFLARVVADGWADRPRGLGVDEATAVTLEPGGSATVWGRGAAYLLLAPGPPQRCTAGQPLSHGPIRVTRVAAGESFDAVAWHASSGASYELDASNGSLRSTQPGGGLY